MHFFHRLLSSATLFASLTLPAFAVPALVEGQEVAPNQEETRAISLPIEWRTDYASAMQEAEQRKTMLFVWLQNPKHAAADDQFAELVLADPGIRQLIEKTVPLRLSLTEKVLSGGEEYKLADHPAFAEMLGKSGFAMIDMTDAESPHFRRVTTAYPFTRQYISKSKLSVLLQLPAVSLTQRTMIYAVRTHPDRPASAWGQSSELLLAETASHSNHQANIQVQGHHNWDARFHSINARLPNGLVATEVCAESWPGQTLVDAAEECVSSWRQSSGHWSGVRERHALFGYDMKRGHNGIWYATGIFARRH